MRNDGLSNAFKRGTPVHCFESTDGVSVRWIVIPGGYCDVTECRERARAMLRPGFVLTINSSWRPDFSALGTPGNAEPNYNAGLAVAA